MKPSFKRLIVFVFLLVLVSLAAHLLADLQHADNGLQVRTDSYLLHTAFLLPVMGAVMISPATIQLPEQKTSPRAACAPLLFRPPIF